MAPLQPNRDPRETTPAAASTAGSTALDVAAHDAELGIAVLDQHGLVVQANPAYHRLLGADTAPGLDAALARRIATSSFAASSSAAPEDLATQLARGAAAILYLRAPHGAPLVLRVAGSRAALRIAVLEVATHLQHGGPDSRATRIDALTGLGNRQLFDEITDNWVLSEASDPALAAVMVDLDRFKQVNESLGHDIGDELLVLVANRLRAVARDGDVALRLESDEFVVVQKSRAQPASAERLAKRLVELLARPFLVQGRQINIGASIGIAIVGHGTGSTAELLVHANLALREAKDTRRGSYRFFDPELARRAHARHELELHLRRALTLKEISLFYQPQMRLRDNRIVGFEALMRWNSPRHGWVSPAEFIPLAEKIGEIDAMGAWALRTACRDAMTWPKHYRVAVNVSPIQFASDELLEAVRGALTASGLPAERLEVEITEGVLLNNTDAAMKRLMALKELGVSIAMDDFGTGYSSLGYLTRFPFSKIKIDQSFLRGEQTPRSRALIQGIIALGERLGMTTIAEGVETEEHIAQLAEYGCMQVQGFLIGRPLPLDGATAFIAAHEAHTTGARLIDATQ